MGADPLHATSSGKVLLAHLPANERTALLGNGAGLKKVTPHTITAGDEAGEGPRGGDGSVGTRGTQEELEIGLHGDGGADPGTTPGRLVAAVSASGAFLPVHGGAVA